MIFQKLPYWESKLTTFQRELFYTATEKKTQPLKKVPSLSSVHCESFLYKQKLKLETVPPQESCNIKWTYVFILLKRFALKATRIFFLYTGIAMLTKLGTKLLSTWSQQYVCKISCSNWDFLSQFIDTKYISGLSPHPESWEIHGMTHKNCNPKFKFKLFARLLPNQII